MPGFNRKGPRGEGPNTGGGFGLCTRENRRFDEIDRGMGRGVGRGGVPWGGGRGYCHGGGRGWQNQSQGGIPDHSGDRIRALEEENETLRRRIRNLEKQARKPLKEEDEN